MSDLKHTLEVIEETIEKGLEAVHLKKKDEANEEAGNYSVETDSLAVPEIHTGKVDTEPEKKDHKVSGISYDNLAMPEVHFRKK